MHADGGYQIVNQLIAIREKELLEIQDELTTLKRVRARYDGTADGAKPLAGLQMAEVVLKKEGKEMHTMQIKDAIQREFDTVVRVDTLGTRLHRASHGPRKRFIKSETAPNTYGLKSYE